MERVRSIKESNAWMFLCVAAYRVKWVAHSGQKLRIDSAVEGDSQAQRPNVSTWPCDSITVDHENPMAEATIPLEA